MLAATVDRHTRVYTYIYMHIPTDVYRVFLYVLVSYIVCICDVYCTYLHVYTYFNVFLYAKLLGASILSYTYNIRVYVQYTYNILNHIRTYMSKYIQYT